MESYQTRVLQEKLDLDEKLRRLSDFLKSERDCALSPAERDRLVRQQAIMEQYSAVLRERILAFPENGV